MRKGFVLISILILAVSLAQFASSEIMLSQPKSLYNLGDKLGFSSTIKASHESEGFLQMSISCDGQEKQIYFSPLYLLAGEEKKIDNSIKLSQSTIGNIIGSCRIIASFLDETQSTSAFVISNKANVALIVDKVNVLAGESISFSGTATKLNGQQLNGFVDAKISSTEFKMTASILNGSFKSALSIPETLKAGSYLVEAQAYDKDSAGNINNIGEASSSIIVEQVPDKIELVLEKQNFLPEDKISVQPLLYDKAGDLIEKDIVISISNNKSTLSKKIIKTSEEFSFDIPLNTVPGEWDIEASIDNIKSKRTIYIEKIEKAEFEIINDSLIVKNRGNVPYIKQIQITIGNDVEIKEVTLAVGENKIYRIEAPSGVYNIMVTDGSTKIEKEGVSLVGYAVNIVEPNKETNLFSQYPIVWIFVVSIFGLFIAMTVLRVKKMDIRMPFFERKTSTLEENLQPVEKIKTIGKNISEAEHSPIIHGDKEESAIVNLKIKNLQELGDDTIGKIVSLIENHSKEFKAAIYRKDDNLMMILTPSITKSFDNLSRSSKLASLILESINEHNRKFQDKINFGLGVHVGAIAANIDSSSGKLKFASIGNSVQVVKKASEQAKSEILMSQEAHNKSLSEIKSEKKGEFYKIINIGNRDTHKKFIQGFLDRNK
jgi:hypothetical protein